MEGSWAGVEVWESWMKCVVEGGACEWSAGRESNGVSEKKVGAQELFIPSRGSNFFIVSGARKSPFALIFSDPLFFSRPFTMKNRSFDILIPKYFNLKRRESARLTAHRHCPVRSCRYSPFTVCAVEQGRSAESQAESS